MCRQWLHQGEAPCLASRIAASAGEAQGCAACYSPLIVFVMQLGRSRLLLGPYDMRCAKRVAAVRDGNLCGKEGGEAGESQARPSASALFRCGDIDSG